MPFLPPNQQRQSTEGSGRRESLDLKTAGIRNNDKVTKAHDKNSVGELPKTHQLKWA